MSSVGLSKGNRVWIAESYTTGSGMASLHCRYGIDAGKMQDSVKEFLGNSRFSALERATTALIKKATDKIQKGYQIEEITDDLKDKLGSVQAMREVMKPYFCSVKDLTKIQKFLPGWVLPKLNGVSGRWDAGKLMSRANKEFKKLAYLKQQFKEAEAQGIPVDGVCFELWHPDMSLEEIVHAVSLDKPEEGKELYCYLYDAMGEGLNFPDRYFETTKRVAEAVACCIQMVAFHFDSAESVIEYFHTCKEIGYGVDGVVIHPDEYDTGYLFSKRPSWYLKVKEEISKEFEIVDAIVDKNKDGLELISYMVYVPEADKRVKIPPTLSHDERNVQWQAFCGGTFDPVGEMLKVEFREWTKYECPRHVTYANIRKQDVEGPANEA